jgi:hypothetical protein
MEDISSGSIGNLGAPIQCKCESVSNKGSLWNSPVHK